MGDKVFLSILLALLAVGAAACGVKGDPIPYVQAYPDKPPPPAPAPTPAATKESPR